MSDRPDWMPPDNYGSPHFDIDYCLWNYKRAHDVVIRPWAYGNILSGIVYGTIIILYFAYIQLLRKQYPKLELLTRQAWMLLGYATLTFMLCTLIMSSFLKKSVELLNYPLCSWDDTKSFMYVNVSLGVELFGNTCFVLISWTADALLIWRCLIMYHDFGRRKWLVISFPLLVQVGSTVAGAYFCYSDFVGSIVIYEGITLGLNVTLTVLIISRLLFLRYRTKQALGSDYGYEYTNVAAMLTESQALSMIAQSIMVAFSYGSGRIWDDGKSLVMYQILAQVQALAPMLVIYRVIQGKAWSSNTFAQITKSRSFETV
ncbi:hypothetical protein BDQ17DRAFT_1545847 [Cyathus striatus]|nr:hypothetical protein BDQ17DRAFT_1545847 [Cyathus striatus]